MSALALAEIELREARDLAHYIRLARKWSEVEDLTTAYPEFKTEAWELLSESDRDRLKILKEWQDHLGAQKFPLGSLVQRLDDPEGLQGKVVGYWRAYGLDYVNFLVGSDLDWCRAEKLKKVIQNKPV